VVSEFGRYSIGSTTDGLKTADDSGTIYIQNEKPKDTSNWPPAPKGPFNLTCASTEHKRRLRRGKR